MASHGRQQAGTAYPPLRCHSRLGCAEAMSAAISSPFTSLASHCIWCTRRTRLVPRIRSLALRTSANRPRIRTERHRRRCDHFRRYRCLQRRQSGVQLVQPQLESALVIAEWPASRPEPHAMRLAAGSAIGPVAAARAPHGRHSAGLDCHGRLACAEAMRTAIMGSPFAPLTPHFIWHISRQLAGAPDVALSSPASASPSIEPLLRSSVSVL